MKHKHFLVLPIDNKIIINQAEMEDGYISSASLHTKGSPVFINPPLR